MGIPILACIVHLLATVNNLYHASFMFYLDLYIYKFKINPNCLILQNISQPLCSTIIKCSVNPCVLPEPGVGEQRETKKNGDSEPPEKATSLRKKLLHSCSLRGFNKLMNFLFSYLSASSTQIVLLLQSSAHLLCQQLGNSHTSAFWKQRG